MSLRCIFKILTVAAMCFGCGNILTELAEKTSDEALFFEAQQLMNDRDYTGAINALQSTSVSFQARRDFKNVLAAAYVGRCGLDFIDLFLSVSESENLSLFEILIGAFVGATDTNISDCIQAEAVMNSISTQPLERTPDENFFIVFSSFTKIGTILNRYADSDDDASTDTGFDHCADIPTSNSEKHLQQIATAMANASLSLAAIGSTALGETLTEIENICSSLGPNDFCNVTSVDDVDSNMQAATKAVVGAPDVGLGVCADYATCLAACP